MALFHYRLRAINPAAGPNLPHVVGFDTPRSVTSDTIFEAWNGPSNADRVFVIDKDGALWLNGSMMISGGRELLNVTLGINDQTGTTYTLAAADGGKIVRLTNSSPVALTVPLDATIPIPVGTVIGIRQGGAGAVTIAGISGVTVNSYLGANILVGQNAGATLHKVATNEWDLDGMLTS